ncbi:unnamed protein product [Candidula unifasciata]|uniref:C-type lectin domain-containing protein n=1 Tax=Candidula unifasciata TaxID=100452 RepID=A0A8S4A0P2_9EUPU|nr:unnamed protein product [Candidula unifasciata]
MRPIIFLSLICLSTAAAADQEDNCPPNIARDQFLKVNGVNCYQFVLGYKLDYTTAQQFCTNRGGTLLLVKSKNVTDFIIDQLTFEFSNANKIWIGLSDRDTEAEFLWEDGTPLGDYTNWGPHSGPSHNTTTSGIQDCVTFDPNKGGLWEEDVCSDLFLGLFTHERPFVCQYRLRGSSTVLLA